MTRVVRDKTEFREACEAARREGRRVGLVPTMGALHAGHLSLVAAAREAADFVAITIFVNPLQFDDPADLANYPKTFDADRAAAADAGVDLIFAPEPGGMYPEGFQTHVRVGALTEPLEGAFRDGHYEGVTTVVTKLFQLAGPCVAFFGRKDYQQWRILARMAHDLDMPIDVRSVPIVREADGLALSSRNVRLDAGARARALSISAGLRAAHDAFAAGERHPERLATLVRETLAPKVDAIDYVAAMDADAFTAPEGPSERLMVLVAAHVAGVRLIDNCVFADDARP